MNEDRIHVASKLMNFETPPKTHDEFYEMMHKFIEDLVLNRTEHLAQTFYRLDIDESRVNEAFEDASSTSELISRITDLLIERLEAIARLRTLCAANNRDER